MTIDPLLQPYQLKHLTLRNRVMSTAHEPAYSEDGMPKARYRLYHQEKARGGVALTMTAGSAVVSRDSPQAFGNLHAWDDAILPWLAELADACHEEGSAVMIQLTHLGRRTGWNKGDWLPVLAASPVREPAHRTFPKEAEDWDLDRIVADYAAAAQRMQAAGLDGIEFEAYGHFMDGFWSPATNRRTDAYGGSLDNRLRFTHRVLDAVRALVGPTFIVGLRLVADEDWDRGLSKAEGIEIARRLSASGKIDFLHRVAAGVSAGKLEVAIGKGDCAPGEMSQPRGQSRIELRLAIKQRKDGGLWRAHVVGQQLQCLFARLSRLLECMLHHQLRISLHLCHHCRITQLNKTGGRELNVGDLLNIGNT
jgi:2,4-dienoyl-CoA reductase-like NADH-dependent reductase (Old Yellow Enzyme family)